MNVNLHIPVLLRHTVLVLTVFLFSFTLSLPQLRAADPQPPPGSSHVTPGNPPPPQQLPSKTGEAAQSGKEVGAPTGGPSSRPRPLPRAPGFRGRSTPESTSDYKAAERSDEHIMRGKQLPKAGITEIRRSPEDNE